MKVAVAIPCYKVKTHIQSVIAGIGSEVHTIYVVDDCCPEQSGNFVLANNHDERVKVLFHKENQGVGGAIVTAYKQAIEDNIDIVVKVDGDGQMDPSLIPHFVDPIIQGRADYTKGSRFFTLESLASMPFVRKFGNASLSFINKVSSGYWNVMDPTNGYTAIHAQALKLMPLDKLSRRYFFESDMLFRLGTLRAVVQDIPMDAVYGDEVSNLSVKKVLVDFPPLYFKAFFKRVFYNYFLRDFNGASMELVLALVLMLFGAFWGSSHWVDSIVSGEEASTGTVMLAVLPIIMGFQLLLSAIDHDMTHVPSKPLQCWFSGAKKK
ncbi:TPA: glycosyltransferase family 2 protein [Vibrio vulnificus]|uniref:Glycosyltransferase family 2 protein n=1 Tax=Vibrio vulnificus TaxID=672 RepID=A0A2S3R602_VIBVL|nr:glycosyltransferase family 2 protein [Vibrio vulnificus]EHH0749904.1 glycosyltransferase family 2 protein [Vibrio vulnificus]EHT4940745.1 glycosyltransferase family 2 protein [Vibrio vulnificus]EJB8415313.1 glycosyltransferase family 2 protein [Vibrio vulnificus]ELP6757192.1 glycosyltransferase family 2 protein [Vibrio vulnificus]MBN8091293.1 glycosyltransferase family 2 protein [Vibrio vulnificus]